MEGSCLEVINLTRISDIFMNPAANSCPKNGSLSRKLTTQLLSVTRCDVPNVKLSVSVQSACVVLLYVWIKTPTTKCQIYPANVDCAAVPLLQKARLTLYPHTQIPYPPVQRHLKNPPQSRSVRHQAINPRLRNLPTRAYSYVPVERKSQVLV